MKFKQKTLILAILLSLAGSFILPVSHMKSYAASPVTLDVTCGYGEAGKNGRYVPMRITLTNPDSQDFEGTVRIQTMESDFDVYDYDYPVSIKASETTEKAMDIPVGRADILYVKLLAEDDTELISKRLKTNVSAEVAELFVGILSDTPEKLNYMNGVGVNYSSVKTKIFDMTDQMMPEKATGLNLLDVLLITNYDTKQLSTRQVSAIWEWVKGGGTLLIGTGARADDTLAAFRTEILSEDYPQPEEKSINMGIEYSTDGPGDSFIELVCADVSLRSGMEVLTNDEFPVLTSTSKGKGTVGVAAYDFVDISPFCEIQRSYVDKLLTSLLGEDKLSNLSSYIYNGNSSQFWSAQSMLNTGDVDKLPNMPLYVVVILGYIILVGPGLYLILKRQERRRFFRSGVVIVAALFTVIIYLMGMGTRFKSTFFTYATVLDTSEDFVDEYTYINMRTPYNKPYAISLNPSYDLQPITRSYYYDMTPVPKFIGNEDYKVRIKHSDEETKVSVQNTVAFTPKYFSLKKKTANTEHVGLSGNITLFNSEISGSVTNEYSFPVEKVGVMMYGKMIIIDELQPGETKNLDGIPVINYPIGNSYLVSERVSGGYKYPKTDIENKDYMLALSRTNILSFYLDNYESVYSPQARIVAFGKEQSESKFLAKGDYETYGTTMYTSSVAVNTKKNGYTYRSGLMKTPTVISGQYYANANMAYGVDPVTLEYSLGNDIEVNTLTFETLSEDFLNNEKYNDMTLFTGTIYFYNHDTGSFDGMETGKVSYTAWELAPYLSPGNTLTVKYICDSTSDYNWYASMPMPIVLGKDK